MNPYVLQAIIDGSSDFIAAVDTDLTYIALNRSYVDEFDKLYGQRIKIGDNLRTLLAPQALDAARSTLQRSFAGESFRIRTEAGLVERRRRMYEFSFHPIRDESGIITGAAQMVRDVTENARWMDFALECAKAGTWSHDLLTDQMSWDPEFFHLFGIDRSMSPSSDIWVNLVVPEDRETILAELRGHIAEGRTYYRLDFRIVHPIDGLKWLASFGRISYDADGRPVRRAGLSIDVTELKVAQLSLAEARDEALKAKAEAERADSAKSKFLAAVSHDLRQPAQSLTLLASLLKDRAEGTALARLAEPIDQAVGALKLLLDGLLDISRLDAKVIVPAFREISLAEVLNPLLVEYGARAAEQGLELRAVPTSVQVRTDPTLLERMLRQLLENALRFTRHGRILVGCRRRGGRVWLEVVDSGIGIAASEHSVIFDEFYQIGNISRDRAMGLGLGLAVVRRLARLLNSEVRLRSTPGRGSKFGLSLETALRQAPESSFGTPKCTIPNCAILVIEDEEVVRVGIRLMLEQWGYQVVVVASGEEAVELVRKGTRPCIILADFRLSGRMTGVEAVTAVRQVCGRSVPALIITGDIAADRLQEMRRNGFSVLYKPVGAEALAREVALLAAAL
jgi:signal transduction histidine kinase/CheY-like chemotaxis protein